MELMTAPQCLHHLPWFQVVQTNCTPVLVLVLTVLCTAFPWLLICTRLFIGFRRVFLFLVLEAWDWVYNVFYFFGRADWVPIFVHLLPVFFVVLVSVLLEELLMSLVHACVTTHSVDVDSCETSAIHALRSSLTIEEYLLGLAVRLELIALTLLTARLTLMWSPKYLPSEIHLYCWVTLQLREDVLHIVHYIRQVNEILRLLLLVTLMVMMLLLLWRTLIHPLGSIIAASWNTACLRYLTSYILNIW